MKETEVLEAAAEAIAACFPFPHSRWAVVVKNKKISCVIRSLVLPKDIIAFELTSNQITNGLESNEWNRLDGVLRRLVREGVL